MKRLTASSWMKYFAYTVMAAALTVSGMPQAPIQPEQKPLGETVFQVEEFLTAHSSVKQTADASLTAEGEEGFTPDMYGDLESVAAMWVDGESVPMSQEQVSELEKKIYACKSQSELDALMRTLQYYNRGVDFSRFDWYWVQLEPLYSDKQIAQMRYGKREWVIVPNVVGMKAREAFQLMSNLGFLARLAYYPNPSSDLPVDYCYGMDATPGELWPTDASIILSIQAPMEIDEGIFWDPDDLDFDINAIAKDIRENGRYTIPMPNVVGLSADEALRVLEEAGYKNVQIGYSIIVNDAAPGCCYDQAFPPGTPIYNTTEFWIWCKLLPTVLGEIPDVIRMLQNDAAAALEAAGFSVRYEYVDEPISPVNKDCCIRLNYIPGSMIDTTNVITLFIQTAPHMQPSYEYAPDSGT